MEDYGSKINYSLAVKKYQPEKKAAIVSDIFSTVLYIVGEDGIDSEKIEEIRQSVSAKSYIEDETWDMAEKAFRGVVVGVNTVVAAGYYGNVGDVESGKTTITSTVGNKIDVTPSSNHTSVNKNPGPYGEANTSVDILDAEGNIKTRRWYDSDGKAYRDVDMSDHGNPKEHPEVPHEHTWEYNNGKPKRK